jgi:hypothetical protein
MGGVRLATIVILVGLLWLSAPAAASPSRLDDRTASLLSDLDRCAPQAGQPLAPLPPLPLGTLIALADGRSAREFATLVERHGCLSDVRAIGEGEDEVVLVSPSNAPARPNGAILWVDHGWWRIARAPTGQSTTLVGMLRVGDSREIFYGLGSGGSAGDIGVVGMRLSDAGATVVLDATSLVAQLSATLLDRDHVLVWGRKLAARPYAWPSNCCLPGGHEWLFERQGSTFAAIDERQAVDPYFALSAFIGGASVRDPAFMRDVGTDPAIRQALDGVPMDAYHTMAPSGLYAITREELMSWDAIPSSVRAPRPVGPIYESSYVLNARYQPETSVIFQLDRDAAGWRVIAVFSEDLIVRRPHGPS